MLLSCDAHPAASATGGIPIVSLKRDGLEMLFTFVTGTIVLGAEPTCR